jgi:hypothetical protein
VDVRVIAATNRNIEEEIRAGRFGADLFHRLNVTRLHIPPLRERSEEVPLFIVHFLERYQNELRRKGLRLSDEVKRALLNYDWPGNVRQLAHEMYRLVLRAGDQEVIGTEHLSQEVRDGVGAPSTPAVATGVGNNEAHGEPEGRKIVQACLEKIKIDSDSGRIIQITGSDKSTRAASEHMDLISLDDPDAGKHTKALIWFGVEREEFGAELSTLSPWTVFIDRLAEMADSALLRLKMHQIQNEAAETRNLATYVVTSHTVFHQIANMVRDIANPISSLMEAAGAGALNADQEIIDLINLSDESAAKLLDFAFTLMNVNKMDTHHPCLLLRVIKESRDLFDFGLKNNQISLDVNIAEDLNIDVLFNVAFLVIANLLSNAKDAISKRGGKIWIEAENVGDMIHCYVMNADFHGGKLIHIF